MKEFTSQLEPSFKSAIKDHTQPTLSLLAAAHSLQQCCMQLLVREKKRSKDQEKMRALPLRVTMAFLAILLVTASFQDLTVAAGDKSLTLLTLCGWMDADGGGGVVPAVPESVCDAKCQKRCSMKVAGRCMGLCKMCCRDCGGCVPSGPYASKDECPCYRDMVSPKSRRPKCP